MITATIVTNNNKTRYNAQASVTSPPVVPVHSRWRHEDGEFEARLENETLSQKQIWEWVIASNNKMHTFIIQIFQISTC